MQGRHAVHHRNLCPTGFTMAPRQLVGFCNGFTWGPGFQTEEHAVWLERVPDGRQHSDGVYEVVNAVVIHDEVETARLNCGHIPTLKDQVCEPRIQRIRLFDGPFIQVDACDVRILEGVGQGEGQGAATGAQISNLDALLQLLHHLRHGLWQPLAYETRLDASTVQAVHAAREAPIAVRRKRYPSQSLRCPRGLADAGNGPIHGGDHVQPSRRVEGKLIVSQDLGHR
mmetsp:Transcript_38905/g.103375  ORF Transcript_38905/g.103375 Transcript_38905/m.103375 type:complete len:227 (-) Transcript_38905:360-1040(-)